MGMNMLTPREAINLYLKSGENKWDLTNEGKHVIKYHGLI